MNDATAYAQCVLPSRPNLFAKLMRLGAGLILLLIMLAVGLGRMGWAIGMQPIPSADLSAWIAPPATAAASTTPCPPSDCNRPCCAPGACHCALQRAQQKVSGPCLAAQGCQQTAVYTLVAGGAEPYLLPTEIQFGAQGLNRCAIASKFFSPNSAPSQVLDPPPKSV